MEEQRAIDSGSNPKAEPGKSLHQEGRAIDINSSQALELKQSGLLERYGFKSGLDFKGRLDPPHIYMRRGGIADGSPLGYPATLHGREFVTPLQSNSILEKLATTPSDVLMSTVTKSYMSQNVEQQSNTQVVKMLIGANRRLDSLIELMSSMKSQQKTIIHKNYA